MTISITAIVHTVNNCCNADGHFTPPFVVYKAKQNFRLEWTLGGPTGTKYSISDSGWMGHDTFIEWLKEMYIPEWQATSVFHFYLDGHTTHVSLAAALACHENTNNFDLSTSSFISYSTTIGQRCLLPC